VGLAAAAHLRAEAQLFAGGAVALLEHRVDAGFGVEVSSGPMGFAEIGILASRVQGSVTLGAGRLTGTGLVTDRDVGMLVLRTGYLARSWLTLEGGVTIRTYSAEVGRQRWVLLRLGAEARVPFLNDRMAGVARLGVLPVASVTGLGRSEAAFTAAAGMAYRRSRLTLELVYALERYDFPATTVTTADRREQLSSLMVRVSARRRAPPVAVILPP
jgi:hypothetical protein